MRSIKINNRINGLNMPIQVYSYLSPHSYQEFQFIPHEDIADDKLIADTLNWWENLPWVVSDAVLLCKKSLLDKHFPFSYNLGTFIELSKIEFLYNMYGR